MTKLKEIVRTILNISSNIGSKIVFSNFSFSFSEFYIKKAKIIFHKANIKLEIKGIDIKTQKSIYYKKIKLNKEFIFDFTVEENQRVKFEIIISNFKLYRRFTFYISDIKTNNLHYNKIAHAMGSINGLLYTNTYEAFLENYNKGFRVFEVDLQLTKDKVSVLFHDLKDYSGTRWMDKDISNMYIEELKEFKYNNRYNLLTLIDLIDVLHKHKDVFIVLDMKSSYINRIFFISIFTRIYYFYLNQFSYENNFTDLFKKYFRNSLLSNDDIILNEIINRVKDRKILDRIIPQVNIKNIKRVYEYYDFPIKIWRDNSGTFNDDIKYITENNISNYSRDCMKSSKEEIDIITKNKIKLYFYNTNSCKNKIEKEIGYFLD